MSAPAPERLTVSRVLSHLGVMTAVSVILGVVTAGLMIPFAGVVGMGARDVAESMDALPAELETKALPQRTRIVDANNKVIATLYDENRVNVSLSQISRTMIKAIVAIEDYRFYEHGALDLKGTLRALVTNQASSGVVQGGSSITQQMVKLTLVQQAETEEERKAATDDTYDRKLRELRYAIAVEENYTKDWILERYLNIAYFGDGAYGIQAAARHYFDKNAKKLNIRESAMLAGLVKNPTGYDPTNSPSRALARRNVVLDRMAELSVITDEQHTKARESDLGLRTVDAKNGCVNSTAAFFCDYVVQYLLKDRSLGRTPQDRRNMLQTGGLTIRTTLDQRYQDAADESVSNTVYADEQAIGGLAMVEPGTGAVKAVSQSRPMGRRKALGETFLNYAVNQKYGDSKGFQGGSTFKAFVLAAAVEKGISLATTIPSPESLSISESRFENCGEEPYGYGTWSLNNSTSSGTMNLYTGTRLSVNTFYAQLEAMTGLCEPFQLARRMGLDLDNPNGRKPGSAERVPSFTLGIPDVSPLEMAEAYATFAARGLHCESRPVTQIEDSQGNSLKKYPARCDRVMEESTADAVNDVLRGVIEGGFASAQALGQPAAGKTGTTQDNKAVWFVGYTPNLAAASMIAGANEFGSPQELTGVLVGGTPLYDVSGSGTAGPMWGDAMKVIAQWLDDEDFVYPSTVPGAGSTFVPLPPKPDNNGNGGGGNGGDGNGGGGNGGGGNGGGNGGGGGGGRGRG